MKKVLVLAALIAMVSTSAMALTVKGTKHDISANGGGAFKSSTTEVCVFCHTPHGATQAAGKYTPLWNRVASSDATENYNSTTFSQNASVNVVPTDAYLCLSCHDGSQQLTALTNPPNSGLTTTANVLAGNLALGTTLGNDHPIGFAYDAAATADGALNLVAMGSTGLAFFGAGSNMMWCSSCHDVHDNTNGLFLAVNNAGSNLCITCHVK